MFTPTGKRPRRAPLKRMHVEDAGQGMIRFECGRCGYDTGWMEDELSMTQNKKGIPCPVCNSSDPTD